MSAMPNWKEITGVIQQGHQIAYAGPFKLGNANYSEAEWFRKALSTDVFVSDVLSGIRGLPHFIISVKQKMDGESRLLRATIDFVAFNNLVKNIRIGETGVALIINHKNEFGLRNR